MGFWNRIFGKPSCNKTGESDLEDLLAQLDPGRLPMHIAIIMDGNGRWAKRKGLPRAAGHRAGVESLRDIVDCCSSVGIKYLTVYAFSTENWKRPQEEVNILMDLLVEYLRKEIDELHRNNVRVRAIGRIQELSQIAQEALQYAFDLTDKNDGLTLNLALNYGGRTEIVDALQRIINETVSGGLKEDISETLIERFLYTAGIPDPDLVIRPSGELRISNFLLWQIAYSEFYYLPVLWPDFRKAHLAQALLDYQSRKRRFGGL